MDRTPGLVRMLLRALVKHCPRCGSGALFERWFKMRPRCPRCALRFERESGGWLGAVVINLGAAQTLVVTYVVLMLVLTLPDVPIVPVIAGGSVLLVTFSVLFLPLSKTLWTAVDLRMRRSPEDNHDVERA